ncbi:hypothetical protein K439DRAFT_1630317, partial [Ramaria rubella]
DLMKRERWLLTTTKELGMSIPVFAGYFEACGNSPFSASSCPPLDPFASFILTRARVKIPLCGYWQETHLELWPPFTLLGFDQLAEPLDDATNVDFMLSLGRPLFKTIYTNGSSQVKEGIIRFAAAKLQSGQDPNAVQIAPLAVRLPLTFNSMTPEGRDAEQLQVESHMRICLKIEPASDAMYTIAPSEPALLEKFMSNRFLSKGDRGEQACMLLMLLAHDQACHRFRKTVPVTDFLTNLFAEQHRVAILDAQLFEGEESLKDMFKDSWVHFTHFVKVTDYTVIDRKFLLRMMVRGAAILCADNQLGVDAIIPACYKGKTLEIENITPILAQFSENVFRLSHSGSALFANMDPEYIGVFSTNTKADLPPAIKLVMSLGTPTSLFSCTPPKKRPSLALKQLPSVSPNHYEFFAAGLSHEIFRPIRSDKEATWRGLAPRSGVEDIFAQSVPQSVLDVARRMTPCVQSDPGH